MKSQPHREKNISYELKESIQQHQLQFVTFCWYSIIMLIFRVYEGNLKKKSIQTVNIK